MSAQEHREQSHLRLVECVQCEAAFTEAAQLKEMYREQSVQVVQMAARIEQLEDGEDLRNAEKELRKVRRLNTKLHNELAEKRKQDPNYTTAAAIFEYWKKECGRGPQTKFTEDREKAVLKALQIRTPRYICLAILGAKYAANVSDTTGERFDDLELICRGSKTERFVDRYRLWREKQGLEPVSEESSNGDS